MSLANGLGSVIVSNSFIYGIPPNLTSTAQLHATKHANGIDYWIMIHEHPSNFRAYLLSAGGLNPTAIVSSSIGLSYDCNSTGFLKFSPTGQKLCASVSYGGIELYDFNDMSGLVSNPLTLISNTLEANYFGCAFSADGTKLYAGHNIAGSTNSNLIQWDINAGSAQAILSSSVNIPSNSFYPQVLQLAPNGKIYIATQNSQSLSVINNPNASGNNCNLVVGGQLISAAISASVTSYSNADLPNIVTNIKNTPCVTQSINNPQSICAGNFYAINNKTHTTAGTYIDTLINVFNCDGISVVNTQLTVNNLPVLAVNAASSVCVNQSLTLTASGANTYTWNNSTTGNQYSTYTFTNTGNLTYSVQLQGTGNASCVATNTVSLSVLVQACGLGIKSNDLKYLADNIEIYPNPTSGNLNLSLSSSMALEILGYIITNNLGQRVRENEIKNNSATITISDLAPGMYEIHFKTQLGSVTKNLLKQIRISVSEKL